MRLNFASIIVLAAASVSPFGVAALPQRVSYPGTLDASVLSCHRVSTRAGESADEAKMAVTVEFAAGSDIVEILARHGVRPGTVISNMATARVSAEVLSTLACEPEVISISAREVLRMTDCATALTRVDEVHAGAYPLSKGYDGTGVIIGVIDSGFDYLHPAFADANGKNRISVVWDQSYPAGTVGSLSDFGYGTVIEDEAELKRVAHDFSSDTHGTHVASIAASSADVYPGVAPGAELALVSTDRSEAGIADALSFLLDYARERGKPIAVNISMGTILGFKDGSDHLARIIDGLLADKTGSLVAIAAGNEGHRKSTMMGDIDGGAVVATRLLPPSYNRENLFVGSAEGAFDLTLNLRDSGGKTLFTATFPSDSAESVRYDNLTDGNDGSYLVMSPYSREDGATSISVNLYSPLPDGRYWEVEISDLTGRYILSADYGELSDGSNSGTIACTACGVEPISVGAYVSRSSFVNLQGEKRDDGWVEGETYRLSGNGPTFDGRVKPDAMAPGAYVVSAINSYASQFSVNVADLVFSRASTTVENRKDYWGAMSGTSMATPVVTGIMALWLQANPELTASDAHKILDGGDKVDAFEPMTLLTSGVELPAADDSIALDSGIYDMRGVRVTSTRGTLLPGLYIVKTGDRVRKLVVGKE